MGLSGSAVCPPWLNEWIAIMPIQHVIISHQCNQIRKYILIDTLDKCLLMTNVIVVTIIPTNPIIYIYYYFSEIIMENI